MSYNYLLNIKEARIIFGLVFIDMIYFLYLFLRPIQTFTNQQLSTVISNLNAGQQSKVLGYFVSSGTTVDALFIGIFIVNIIMGVIIPAASKQRSLFGAGFGTIAFAFILLIVTAYVGYVFNTSNAYLISADAYCVGCLNTLANSILSEFINYMPAIMAFVSLIYAITSSFYSSY